MSVPSCNWAAGAFQRAFQKTFTNVFYSRPSSATGRITARGIVSFDIVSYHTPC